MAAVTNNSPSLIADNGHYSPQRGTTPPIAQAPTTGPPQPAASTAATATPPQRWQLPAPPALAAAAAITTSVNGGSGSSATNVYGRSVIASGVALFATDQHHLRHECTEFSYFIYMYYLVVLIKFCCLVKFVEWLTVPDVLKLNDDFEPVQLWENWSGWTE